MLNNFYHGKCGSENRTDIALKCQTLQVNQKPEVAVLHNNLYHINSDGINVNNLRCWSVRDIFTSSKNTFLSCWTWNFWKTSNYPQIFTKIQIRFQNDSYYYYFLKSTWLGLSINFLLFFVFRVLELDFFVWEILTGHFEESLWIFFLSPNAMHCDTRRIH